MKNDIRFVLERYHAGGATRYVCPQCGRKKCFTRYVDLETGEYVADDCGFGRSKMRALMVSEVV